MWGGVSEDRDPPDAHPPGSGRKRPYQTPELVKVPLRIEEAILGACKTSFGGGVGSGSDCTVCSSAGS